MPRSYDVIFSEIEVGNPSGFTYSQIEMELFFPASTYKALRLVRHWFKIIQNLSLATSLFFEVNTKILQSTVTHGNNSAGASLKTNKVDPGDSNPSFSTQFNVNSGGFATTTGAINQPYSGGFYLLDSEDWSYPNPPVIIGGQGQSLIIDLLTNIGAAGISGSVYVSGGCEVIEMG